jgi:hypothetical protein
MTVSGYEASATEGPLEVRLQIVVEVRAATDDAAARDGAAHGVAPDTSRLPQLLESAHSLLRDLSQGLEVRMASFTGPNGVRVVAQGTARPEDLAAIRAAAAALGQRSPAEP